jgi:hypothetical protein
MAKYSEKPVADWTVNDMLAYLADQHIAKFGVDYQPFGTWASERGQLGNWIGTRKKAGKYGAEFTKRFVDECMKTYRPKPDYPGMPFGFMVAYRKQIIQRLQLEVMREDTNEKSIESSDNFDDVSDWL